MFVYDEFNKCWSHLRHQNYDPINLETFEDHSQFILEESPPFLTIEEIEALRNDIANISIQPFLTMVCFYCLVILI